jgi:hypothetical protein
LIEDGCLSVALIHFWPGNAVRVVTEDPIEPDRWQQVIVTHDGSGTAAGLGLYLDGQPVATKVIRDSLTQAIHGSEAKELTIGHRFRDVGFKGGRIDELQLFETELTPLECTYLYWQDALSGQVLQAENSDAHEVPKRIEFLLAECRKEMLDQFHRRRSTEYRRLADELFRLREQYSQLTDPIPEVMVMREMPSPRPTAILHRGEYDAPGELVGRGVPSSLPPLKPHRGAIAANGAADHRRDPSRLDLAGWLTDPDHPLTYRVIVNRIWQSIFGRGLVATSEDFGFQGAPPTHPELLDWLSVYFVESGWDTKALIRLIVTSSVYRQSSDLTDKLLKDDPENRWLARGPAFRLSAELVRDAALSASGLLVDTRGGPPVKPYQPEGLWEEKSQAKYERDVDQGSRRRSLYTYWKRTSPPPSMMTFDASNREVCIVRRQSTMTPLQTLVLLNDPQFVEAARGLAESALREHSSGKERLISIFRRLTARVPTDQECDVLVQMLEDQVKYYQENHSDAKALLQVGDHRTEFTGTEELVQLAALSSVAGGLMSYDEFVMKR